MAKKKNWTLIIIGIVIFVIVIVVAGVAGIAYYTYKQMDITTTSTDNPDQAFAQARARFQGQVPYVEFAGGLYGNEATVHHELEKSQRASLSRLRIIAYNPDDRKMVTLAIPFWLLRWGHDRPLKLNQGGFDPGVQLTITTEDLERRGPGLVFDAQGKHGERFIVWSE